MERTKLTVHQRAAQLQTLESEIVARAGLASRLGVSFGGDRNLYESLGYPTEIKYSDYHSRYSRQDIAKAVIDRPVKLTWKGKLEIVESDDDMETALEKQWKKLNKEFKLKSKFSRVDRLAGIGCFGVLLLGLSDVKKPEDFKAPVLPGGKPKLAYVRPFGEGSVKISEYETDPQNKRYGQPLIYQITITDSTQNTTRSESATNKQKTILVHHTRIVHIVDDILENEILGFPRLEVVYNRLMDLEKLVGGDAEMFWKGARPGYQGKLDKDYRLSKESKDDLKDQIDEYEHNLRRVLMLEGISFDPLQQQFGDPSPHVDIQMQMISSVTGIPKRILTGSERGELSSGQDSNEWKDYIQTRREEHAETNIVRPFVDRMIELGILPEAVDEYSVGWSDLYAMSEKEMVDLGKVRAESLKAYVSTPMAEAIVSPKAFFEFFLGLREEQVELIMEMMNAGMKEEKLLMPPEEEEPEEPEEEPLKPKPAKAPGAAPTRTKSPTPQSTRK